MSRSSHVPKGGMQTFVVIGTHGRTGLLHLLMGSTAEYIVRHSRLPVMVVPSTGSGAAAAHDSETDASAKVHVPKHWRRSS